MSQDALSKLENHLERVAYHEAGHALLYACFGVSVDSITIHSDFAGETKKEDLGFDEEDPDLPLLLRLRQAAIAVAGCVSEGKYVEDDPCILLYEGGWDDLTHINRVNISKEVVFRLIDHFVTPIVEAHWDKIERLSAELIKRKTMQKDCIGVYLDSVGNLPYYNQRLEVLIDNHSKEVTVDSGRERAEQQ